MERGYTKENVQEKALLEYEAYKRYVKPECRVANIIVKVSGRWQYSILPSEAL